LHSFIHMMKSICSLTSAELHYGMKNWVLLPIAHMLCVQLMKTSRVFILAVSEHALARAAFLIFLTHEFNLIGEWKKPIIRCCSHRKSFIKFCSIYWAWSNYTINNRSFPYDQNNIRMIMILGNFMISWFDGDWKKLYMAGHWICMENWSE